MIKSVLKGSRSQKPKISVVIPSYNYGRFLERAILSVIKQDYTYWQLIIIDGMSTDSTNSILQRYTNYIDYWVSESDNGQTDALNKGYKHATGEIFTWLNADDAFRPNAFSYIASRWQQGFDLIAGYCCNHYELKNSTEVIKPCSYNFLSYFDFVEASFKGFLPQPAVFISTIYTQRVFPLDIRLRRAMDYQYFLRIFRQAPYQCQINEVIVDFYFHGSNLTSSSIPLIPELISVCNQEIAQFPANQQSRLFSRLRATIHIQEIINDKSLQKPYLLLINSIDNPGVLSRLLWWKILLRSILINCGLIR